MLKIPKAPSIRVDVSQKEIDEAIPRASGHCMIKEAVKRAYPSGKSISVDLQTIRVTDPKRSLRYTYLTPRIAAVALVHWDEGTKPAPFDFILRKGQVTKAGTIPNLVKKRKKESVEVHQKRLKSLKKASLVKAMLIQRRPGSGLASERIGGKAPPKMTGFRREFGLRAFIR